MAKPRKTFGQLSAAQQKRKLSWYKRNRGLSPSEVERQYNAGTLGPQSAVRGHSETPEHGLKDALKKPDKYSEYVRKRQVPAPSGAPVPASVEDEARLLNTWRDKAYNNMVRKLGNLIFFDADAVSDRVYGGAFTPLGFTTAGMDLAEAQWTAKAKKEELRGHASPQYFTNPWWYHSW